MRIHCLAALAGRYTTAASVKNATSSRSAVATYARRNRNLFQDPTASFTSNEFSSLYRSFNDEDDVDDPASYGTPVLADEDKEDGEGNNNNNSCSSSSSNTTGLGKSKKKNIRLPSPKVTSAEFIKSSVALDQCPAPIFPEFAVIGRSNVGKSSLINMLTGRNALAMVSKTPGKTKCINHFLINKSWYLVDLPGIGYARTSRENIEMWNKFTREFFLHRETLVNVFLLVDASIEPMDIDLESAKWLGECEIPFTVVFTKLDKKKKKGAGSDENIEAFEKKLLENFEELPRRVRTSSREGLGKGQLLGLISQMRAEWMSG